MFDYQKIFLDEKDLAENKFRKAKRGKSLQEFVAEKPGIYDQFKAYEQEQSRKKDLLAAQKEEEDQQRLMHSIVSEAKDNMLDSPTFEEFFGTKSRGKSVFDKFSGYE